MPLRSWRQAQKAVTQDVAVEPAKLIVETHDGSNWEAELTEADTLIGRGTNSDVRLTDPSSSRDHAAISCEGEVFTIEDLQTTNGTRVNGKRVRSTTLESGDLIEIGQSKLTFQRE